MAGKSPKSSASDPLAAALRLLGRRDRSTVELTGALHRRGFDGEESARAVARCRELGYLDDRRFACERARALLRTGRAAGAKIIFDLRRRGIRDELIEEAVAAAEEERSPQEAARDLLARRFPDLDFFRADEREKRRVLTFFQRRGFSPGLIIAILKENHDDSW